VSGELVSVGTDNRVGYPYVAYKCGLLLVLFGPIRTATIGELSMLSFLDIIWDSISVIFLLFDQPVILNDKFFVNLTFSKMIIRGVHILIDFFLYFLIAIGSRNYINKILSILISLG
jgi:hypothetical protein